MYNVLLNASSMLCPAHYMSPAAKILSHVNLILLDTTSGKVSPNNNQLNMTEWRLLLSDRLSGHYN